MRISRRGFTLGAVPAVFALAPGTLNAAAREAAGRLNQTGDEWHSRFKRMVQVNFNERDPEGFDVEEWTDYLAAARTQVTYLSITNVTAFYPSKLTGLPASRYLGTRDLFGECVTALRTRGIRIIGRLSIDTARADLAELHPDWFRRTKDGAIPGVVLANWTDRPEPASEFAPTCPFSSYYSEFVPDVIREVLRRYPVDGIYSNAWPSPELTECYCKQCSAIGDPRSAEYHVASQKRTMALWSLFDRTVRSFNPRLIFTGNLGGGFKDSWLDMSELVAQAPWFMADNQARGNVGAPAWDVSQQIRIGRAVAGGKNVLNATAAYAAMGEHRWRNVTGNPDEVRLRLFQTIAAGGAMQYHWLGFEQGFRQDRRWQDVGREVLSWQADNDPHFQNVASLANVCLFVSQRSNRLYSTPAGTDALDGLQGMYLVLNEARIPFDVVCETDLSERRLAQYSVMIMPNIAVLSDEEVRRIEAFVARGGSLLSTFETGLYFADGKPRADFALGRMFGMSKTGAREGFGRESAGRRPGFAGTSPIQKLGIAHPLTSSFSKTTWIEGSSWRIPIKVEGQPVLTHLPRYPWYPTEAVYPRDPGTGEPTVAVNTIGAARLVHFAEDIDGGYWRTGAADLGDLLVNALRWLTRDRLPARISGDGLVEIFAWRTEPGYALHLLNYTNPNFRAVSTRQTYSIGAQTVRMELIDSRRVRTARLLRSGGSLPFSQSGNVIQFTVPSIKEYEVVAIEV